MAEIERVKQQKINEELEKKRLAEQKKIDEQKEKDRLAAQKLEEQRIKKLEEDNQWMERLLDTKRKYLVEIDNEMAKNQADEDKYKNQIKEFDAKYDGIMQQITEYEQEYEEVT